MYAGKTLPLSLSIIILSMTTMRHKMKYFPGVITTLTYLLMLGLNIFLILGRKKASIRLDYLNDFLPEFYSHVSNFSISMLLIIVVGYIWILLGVGIKPLLLLVLTVMVVNVIYELFIPVLNTRDITDAWYGVAGSIAGGLYLVLVKQYGVKPAPPVTTTANKTSV